MSKKRDRSREMISRQVLHIVLLGTLIGCPLGCAGIGQQYADHCGLPADSGMPRCHESRFQAISPIPCACRRASTGGVVGSTRRLSPAAVPPLPPLGQPASAEKERIARLERRVQQLQALVDRQQQLLDKAQVESARIDHSLHAPIDEIRRELADIQQQQAAVRLELTALSGEMDRLTAVQATDRAEQARVLDEIIDGLEQALSPVRGVSR